MFYSYDLLFSSYTRETEQSNTEAAINDVQHKIAPTGGAYGQPSLS
jgi:hypothetical protein